MSQSFNIDGGEGTTRANDEVDLYDRATSQTAQDDILGETNVGLGNYTKKEYWMQVDAYRKWVFAHSAIARPMNRRVIDYALVQAAKEEWQELDADEREAEWERIKPDEDTDMDRRRWIQQKKADLWSRDLDEDVTGPNERQEMRQEARREIIKEHGRGDLHWQPPFGRILKMRHEASRSIGSRLLDNLFGRVSVEKLENAARDTASGLSKRFGTEEDDREP